MNNIFVFFAFLILLPIQTPAATLSTNEILAQLQNTIESGEGFDELSENLGEMEGPELEELLVEIDGTYRKLRELYQKSYREFAEGQFKGPAKNESSKMIRQHRNDFMEIYGLAEGPMKPKLKEISMPAVEALRKLVMPTAEEVLATAPEPLRNQRKIIFTLAKFRDAIVKTGVLIDQEAAEMSLLKVEKDLIASYGVMPRDGLRIIAENDKIAEKEKIPVKEREGIREVNEWRLLLGLNALLIDPKLCEASRGHSEDMANEGFFAHESPVPGKKTPWDRAAAAGTKARGENIYMGNDKPENANKGWFYSPGHHKNMFGSGHKMIGLGQYQKHWTQMFG